MKYQIIFLFIFSELFIAAGFALEAAIVNGQNERLYLGKNLLYLEDKERNFELANLLALPDSAWQINENAYPGFGFTKSVYWFKKVLITQQLPIESWVIEIPSPLTNSIEFYLKENEQFIDFYHVGVQYPFDERPVEHRDFIFPLTLKSFSTYELYFRAHSTDSLQFPVILSSSRESLVAKEQITIIVSLAFGCLMVMAVYNLFLYTTTLKVEYLLYTLFIISAIYFEATLKGLSYQFIWPDYPIWNKLSVPISIIFASLFSIIFVVSFLRIKKHHPVEYLFFKYLMTAITCFLPFVFVLPLHLTIPICAVIGVSSYVSLLVCAIGIWYKGVSYAKYIVLGWGSLLIGASILGLSRMAIIPSNNFTESAALLGGVLESILASFGLGNRINYERNLRFKAQKEALQHELEARIAQSALLQKEKESKEALEKLVTQRTSELSSALEDLNAANQSLQEASFRDPLTGLYNRRYLHENIEHLLEMAEHRGKQVAMLFLDIDHFKKVNDSHGHVIGDLCIGLVATRLRNYASSDEEYSFRYGGEEFLVFMCVGDVAESLQMAEKIRSDIHQRRIPGTNEALAVSIGASRLHHASDASLDVLIHESDTALYKAKDKGRNCVVLFEKSDDMLKA